MQSVDSYFHENQSMSDGETSPIKVPHRSMDWASFTEIYGWEIDEDDSKIGNGYSV